MNRAYLTKTLELIKPALATTNMVPVFQCFMFAEGTVSAYDDTTAIVGPSEFEGPCGVHGNTLLGLLSNSSADEADLELSGDTLVVTLGKSVSKLPATQEGDFIFEVPDGKWAFKMPFTESVCEALKLCLETVSGDTTQLALQGVTIESDKMYSCNSDVLTRVQLKAGIGKNRIMMPEPFCASLVRLWSSLEMTKGTLHFNGDWCYADLGDWAVYGRILEIKDPIDFDGLIKKTVKAKVPMQPVPAEFAEALGRARVLADAESQKTSISIAKGKLKMATETHMGHVTDEMPFKGHPDITASVHASYLAKSIQVCDHMAIHENCTVMEKGGADVFQLISNR